MVVEDVGVAGREARCEKSPVCAGPQHWNGTAHQRPPQRLGVAAVPAVEAHEVHDRSFFFPEGSAQHRDVGHHLRGPRNLERLAIESVDLGIDGQQRGRRIVGHNERVHPDIMLVGRPIVVPHSSSRSCVP